MKKNDPFFWKKKTSLYSSFSIGCLMAGVLAMFFGCMHRKDYNTWKICGGSNARLNYSALNQIDTNNVNKLKIAWIYHSEDSSTRAKLKGILECNPIIIGNTLYGVSNTLKLFAIDAGTGEEKWKFNPFDSLQNPNWFQRKSQNVMRGVAYWSDEKEDRIIFAAGSVVYAINAKTGKMIQNFGEKGGIDLLEGLDRNPGDLYVAVTSPVAIYKDVFYVGGLVAENTPGFVRAFDVRSGKQKWIFHTIPRPGEKGFDTWADSTAYKWVGSTNSWGGFTIDEERGIVYAPTGSPTNDFYGGKRWGNNLFGSSLVALDANTGKLLWYFQNVHHDVWDRDLPTPPALVSFRRDGKRYDAAVQISKGGQIFIFDRETGKSVYPIEEKRVPVSGAVPGEKLSATQPFSSLPTFSRQTLSPGDYNQLGPDSIVEDTKKRFKALLYKGLFTPPTQEGTLVFPGYDGGGDWGGPAINPKTNMLYINSTNMAWVLNLVKRQQENTNNKTNLQAGKILYKVNCMQCHGANREGGGDYPALINAREKYTFNAFNALLSSGRGMMPGFPMLDKKEREAIASFILDTKETQILPYTGKPLEQGNEMSRPDYDFTGYTKFLTKDGYPGINPPWGQLTAINLRTGKLAWQIPFGEFDELKEKGIPATGRESYGAPVVTAGGVLFIGANNDGKFRAYNAQTGKLLYEAKLPVPAAATPAVYSIDGKEYVVIAAGGSKWDKSNVNDTFIAFTLSD
jgi:quinoprotein glucose dehydrogenase